MPSRWTWGARSKPEPKSVLCLQVQGAQGGGRSVYSLPLPAPATAPAPAIESFKRIKKFLETLLSNPDFFPRNDIIVSLLRKAGYKPLVDRVPEHFEAAPGAGAPGAGAAGVEGSAAAPPPGAGAAAGAAAAAVPPPAADLTDVIIIIRTGYSGTFDLDAYAEEATNSEAIKLITLFKSVLPSSRWSRLEFVGIYTALLEYYRLVCLRQRNERIESTFDRFYMMIFDSLHVFKRYRHAHDYFYHQIGKQPLGKQPFELFMPKFFTGEEMAHITLKLKEYKETWRRLSSSRSKM